MLSPQLINTYQLNKHAGWAASSACLLLFQVTNLTAAEQKAFRKVCATHALMASFTSPTAFPNIPAIKAGRLLVIQLPIDRLNQQRVINHKKLKPIGVCFHGIFYAHSKWRQLNPTMTPTALYLPLFRGPIFLQTHLIRVLFTLIKSLSDVSSKY